MSLANLILKMTAKRLFIKGYKIEKITHNIVTTTSDAFTSFVISVAAGVLLLPLSI